MKSSFFQFFLKKLNYVIHYKPSIYIYIRTKCYSRFVFDNDDYKNNS